MKIYTILFFGLLSGISLSAMASNSLKERFAPTGRIANVQAKLEVFRQELGIGVADDAKKNQSELEIYQELLKLELAATVQNIKLKTAQDIECLQELPHPLHVQKCNK